MPWRGGGARGVGWKGREGRDGGKITGSDLANPLQLSGESHRAALKDWCARAGHAHCSLVILTITSTLRPELQALVYDGLSPRTEEAAGKRCSMCALGLQCFVFWGVGGFCCCCCCFSCLSICLVYFILGRSVEKKKEKKQVFN